MKIPKKTVLLLIVPLAFLLLCASSLQNYGSHHHSTCILDNVTKTGEWEYSCSYENVKHDFILEMPRMTEGAPLVIMLHGYGSNAKNFKLYASFDQDANALGYAVAYVTGAPTPESPTSATGWNSGIGISGNNDVDFLCALANYLCRTYSLDDTRLFAVGFSNGAFMAQRLALEANDTFAAVVSVAGMMPESVWKGRPEICRIGFFQITGEKDDAVPKNSDGSSRFTKAPAIEDVVEYFVQANVLAIFNTCTVGKKANLVKYSSDGSDKQVWNLTIPDGRHSWPDESITGVNTNELILEFLETQ